MDQRRARNLSPAKHHITVPKGFRKYHPYPESLVLYFANLSEEEVWELEGYRVTSPKRTVQDILLDEGFSEELAIQAILNGLEKGMVSLDQVSELKKDFKSNRISRILKGVEKNEK